MAGRRPRPKRIRLGISEMKEVGKNIREDVEIRNWE